ncbi:MAG: energy transducer TonB [Gammaproteobacteria bacterium]|nr:energy transducer TonB [Gammaproteobacteria bacterium]
MVFDPATYNGIPVSSTATMPFKFGLSDSDLAEQVVPPTILSQRDEIAAAHDKCLPADLHEGGSVELALTISRTGRVVAVRTAISSGSDKVDQVAACVARTLRYTRPRYRGQVVEMGGIVSKVRVTPRAQDRPAATE